jgi:hypothetical protein
MLHEIRDSILRGEPDGSAPIFGAEKQLAHLIWEIGNGEDWCWTSCSQFWQSP